MDGQLDTFSTGTTHLHESARPVSADQHDEIIEPEHSHGIAIGMEHVVILDPVPARTRHNHWVIKLA